MLMVDGEDIIKSIELMMLILMNGVNDVDDKDKIINQ